MFLPRRILCSASKTFLVSPVEVVWYYIFSNFPLFLAKQTITKIKVMSKISVEEKPCEQKAIKMWFFKQNFKGFWQLSVVCSLTLWRLCAPGAGRQSTFFLPSSPVFMKIGEWKFEYLLYCKQPKSFRVNGFVKLTIVVDPASKSGYLVA